MCQIDILEAEVSLSRHFLHDPARLTIKTFVGKSLNPYNITPIHLLLDEFANLVQIELSDKDLLMLSLVYWHFDASTHEPSLETRHRFLQSCDDSDEFKAMCDVLCGLYNDRVREQVTEVFFMEELWGLMSDIESLFWCCLQRLSERASP
ncbi:hypothetical protein BDV10DRAFT_188578 [Aspergillus recurvatus]